jgi:hypothetical protein
MRYMQLFYGKFANVVEYRHATDLRQLRPADLDHYNDGTRLLVLYEAKHATARYGDVYDPRTETFSTPPLDATTTERLLEAYPEREQEIRSARTYWDLPADVHEFEARPKLLPGMHVQDYEPDVDPPPAPVEPPPPALSREAQAQLDGMWLVRLQRGY